MIHREDVGGEMTVKEVLIKVRELLSDRKRWTKGALARDRHSCDIGPRTPAACRWCLMGAVYKTCDNDYAARCATYDALEVALMSTCLASFNDDPATKHKDVLALLDKAIEGQP